MALAASLPIDALRTQTVGSSRAVLALAAMKIQILMSPGCGHGLRTAELVAEIVRTHSLDAQVENVLVESLEDATRLAFPGSPTIRVDGVDIEPQAPAGVGLG